MKIMTDSPIRFPGLFGDWTITLSSKAINIGNGIYWYGNEKMKERGVVQIPLCFLAKSLENMSLCHAAFF